MFSHWQVSILMDLMEVDLKLNPAVATFTNMD